MADRTEERWTIWRCPGCGKRREREYHYCQSCKPTKGRDGVYRGPFPKAVEVVPASRLEAVEKERLSDDECELAASALEFASTYALQPDLAADELAKKLRSRPGSVTGQGEQT